MTEFLGFQVEVLAGVIIPVASELGIITWRTAKYFLNKEICFKTLKQTVTRLDNVENESNKTYGNLHEDLNDQSNRITALETKVDLLWKHFNLKI